MASQPTPSPQTANLDRYVVIHVATTCDEHGVYVTKDSAEVIELGWILLDAKSCEELHRESVLVKPVNTPITALCTSLTTLTWDQVRNAGSFRDAVDRFTNFYTEHIAPKNLEFAFVTLDSWDLRVQLPREARDKAVVLPPYLQHSRTFDLRTEYQRWQAHHPESLPFGSSALTNICAALEVEPVQSSAPIKHNLPFHLQALAPASPRRAMEEAVTLARVLRGLIRKSQPPQDHPDVLTKPMDARADVRAFLSERSKVLHMSGLPHDTTQSELESWFTQFGGRPIAFWTLRTPDQHKPTGTGFAIFSSHEEAAESLCMNGRALNEKAIEVSPSSSRVIDRAADIIVPFPPSKNRPRPGDWNCPSCGFSNFQRRTACFRCSFPAMQQGPPGGDPMAYGGYGYGGHPGMMGPPQHHMGHGHGHGMGGGHMRGGTGAVPFRAGDWKCGENGCGYHNFAKNTACLRCGASRAGAAVVADSAFPSPMDTPSGFGMGPPSMGGTPGGGPYGPAGYGGGGFPAQQYGGPPSSYALPSGMGAASPYPPMGAQYVPNGGMHSTPFDSRSAEAAFSSADPCLNQPQHLHSTAKMPKSKRAKVVHLTKTDKKGKELSLKLFANVQEAADNFEHIFVFAVENMRNSYLKELRQEFADSRFFFGKTKVMAKALGLTPAEEHLTNLSELSQHLNGNVGLFFTNRDPSEMIEYFANYSQTDFARAGIVATQTFTVPAGVVHSRGGEVPEDEDVPLPHSMETTIRKWGMPTRLDKGKIVLDVPYTIAEEGKVMNSHQTALLKMFGVAMADFKIDLKAYYTKATESVTEVGAMEE